MTMGSRIAGLRMFRRTLLSVALLCLALGLASCDEDPAAPGIEPEIVNHPESFEFQVSRMGNYSGVLEYTWANSRPSANLDQSVSLSRGFVRLSVSDAEGTIVHDARLEDGSIATSEGQAGDWTLRVQFEHASGTVNFRLQPRTP